MIKKKKKKTKKKIKKDSEELNKKIDKKIEKFFIPGIILLAVLAFALDPTGITNMAIGIGEFIWALIPLALIGAFWAAMAGQSENKSFDKGVFLLFMGMILGGCLLAFLWGF